MKFLIIFIIFSSSLLTSNAKTIEVLGVLPFDSRSHFVIGETIMKSLAEFFHNVTVISPYPQKEELHFFKDISIADGTSDFEFGKGFNLKNFYFLLTKFLIIFIFFKLKYFSKSCKLPRHFRI